MDCSTPGFPVLHYLPEFAQTRASLVPIVVKNQPVNAGDVRDTISIPGSGRSPGEGNDNPLQYSCLKNPMDRGAWWATIHGVSKSQAWLKDLARMHAHWVNDAIQPSHPLPPPSPPAFNLSQHQGLFQWVGSSHQVAKVVEPQLHHQDSQESSLAPQFKSINSLALRLF